MERKLLRAAILIYHYVAGSMQAGPPPGVRGDLSRVSGNLSRVSGDLSGVSGDLSGVSGDLSGVSGNLDDCDITPAERAEGILIDDLIRD